MISIYVVDNTYPSMTIYGELLDPSTATGTDSELVEQMIRDGFLYGRWFTAISPEGDLGFRRQQDCVPCPEAVFRVARLSGWHVVAVPGRLSRGVWELQDD